MTRFGERREHEPQIGILEVEEQALRGRPDRLGLLCEGPSARREREDQQPPAHVTCQHVTSPLSVRARPRGRPAS